MAHHDEAGDPSAALENLDEALSTAVEQLALYLDLNHEPDERSRPADLLAAVLHRYAQQHHRKAHLSQLPLADIIDEVLEAREDSDLRRAEYREEYGKNAGDLLASMKDAANPIPARFEDLCDVDEAVGRYRAKLDRHLGEGMGLRHEVPKNAEKLPLYDAAIDEVISLYRREPERFLVSTHTGKIDRMSVFDFVAPKYGLNPKTLYNKYNNELSSELRARLSKKALGNRRSQ